MNALEKIGLATVLVATYFIKKEQYFYERRPKNIN